MVVDEGRDYLMNIGVALGVAAPSEWYCGIISATSFTGISSGDTAASHGGWTEDTSYSESARPTFVDGGVSGGLVTNPAKASFTFPAAKMVAGAFLVSSSTKGGTGGKLLAAVAFPGGNKSVAAGEVAKLGFDIFGIGQ